MKTLLVLVVSLTNLVTKLFDNQGGTCTFFSEVKTISVFRNPNGPNLNSTYFNQTSSSEGTRESEGTAMPIAFLLQAYQASQASRQDFAKKTKEKEEELEKKQKASSVTES